MRLGVLADDRGRLLPLGTRTIDPGVVAAGLAFVAAEGLDGVEAVAHLVGCGGGGIGGARVGAGRVGGGGGADVGLAALAGAAGSDEAEYDEISATLDARLRVAAPPPPVMTARLGARGR